MDGRHRAPAAGRGDGRGPASLRVQRLPDARSSSGWRARHEPASAERHHRTARR
ncbi:hypothetical protein ACFPRL_27390 [Pseudoclavibacter helvolus]